MLAHLHFSSRRKLVVLGGLIFSALVDGFVVPLTAPIRKISFTREKTLRSFTRKGIHSNIESLWASSRNFDTSFDAKESPSNDFWESEEDDSFPEFDSDDLSDLSDDGDHIDEDEDYFESDGPLSLEYQQWKEALEKCASGLDKKQRSLRSELEKAERVEDTVQRAELITSNMYLFTPGVRTATVNDWNRDGAEVELTLDEAYASASAEADALFQQVRKLKRGTQIVRPFLEEAEEAKDILSGIQSDFVAALLPDGTVNENVLRLLQDRLLRTSTKTGFRQPLDSDSTEGKKTGQSLSRRRGKPAVGSPASNLRKFTSPGGCVVIVGRNRRGNEYLTFNIARAEDVWMQ